MEGSSQTNNISIVGAAQLIYIYIGGLSTNKTIILIRGLGECERIGEDSGSELVM